MRVRIAVVTALMALGAVVGLVPQAQAAGQACVNATLVANGQTVVDEHRCVDLP